MKRAYIFLVFLFTLSLQANAFDSTAVELNGQLKVEGNFILNKNNEPTVLRGMSLFWSQWMGKYYNSQTVKWLKDDWNCTLIRASMGIEMGGYLENKDTERSKVFKVIDACIEEGVYVIVDWHDHHAENHLDEAIEFFEEVAETYGEEPNIIYEIYNEPMQVSWTNVVKPYSDSVVSAIRAIDSNNIILVGNPTWSQDVDIAANDPLDFESIAYSLHFYAASHKQFLRDKAKIALSKGVALFVSEFGTCENTGDGFLDYDETNKWLEFLEDNKISWCNWSIADKVETAAALKPGASSTGGWSETQLTESGKLIKNKIKELNTITSIKNEKSNQIGNSLYLRNYPNPFNSSTTISFNVNENNRVMIDLFNVNGEKVKKLVDNKFERGEYSLDLDFDGLSSGNYFIKYQAGYDFKTLKLQYLK